MRQSLHSQIVVAAIAAALAPVAAGAQTAPTAARGTAAPRQAPPAAARYSAKQIGDVVQLRDTKSDTVVSVLIAVSNAYEFVVKGENLIQMTPANVDAMRASPGLRGLPFLSPFAGRLDEAAFYANGQKYNFDLELGNVRGPVPIHGYLSGANGWRLFEAKSDANGAWVTNKLDFYKNPRYMKQFPFAHSLTMTYRLSDGALEVRTRIDNLSIEPMPVAIGFHPYFQLTDSVRNDWTLSVPAKTHWLKDSRNIPDGRTEPSTTFFGSDLKAIPLKTFDTRTIDDTFSDLERDAQGRFTVSLKGAKQQLDVVLGPKYKAVLVYSTVPGAAGGGRGAGGAAPAAGAAAPTAGGGAAPTGRGAGGGGGRGATPPVSTGPDIPMSAKASTPNPNRGFVALEPMVGIPNSMNLAQKGAYQELQSIEPGGFWQESYWLRPSGF